MYLTWSFMDILLIWEIYNMVQKKIYVIINQELNNIDNIHLSYVIKMMLY